MNTAEQIARDIREGTFPQKSDQTLREEAAWNEALETAAQIFDKKAEANVATSCWYGDDGPRTIFGRLPTGDAKPANGPAIAYLANRDHAHAIRALRR